MSLLTAIVPMIGNVLDKFLKTKQEKAQALLQIEMEFRKQETSLIEAFVKSDVAQAEINKLEAQSHSFFKSGWRPCLAWCCVIGFMWNIFLPAISWGLNLIGITTPLIPNIGGEILVSMTFGILGLGAYRTYEKKTGITK